MRASNTRLLYAAGILLGLMATSSASAQIDDGANASARVKANADSTEAASRVALRIKEVAQRYRRAAV